MTNQEPIVAPTSIPLPSADLITYRFDQVDKQLTHFDKKLDEITNSFCTKSELATVVKDVGALAQSVDTLVATDNRQQGAIDANKRNLTVALSVLGIVIGALTTYLGLHK